MIGADSRPVEAKVEELATAVSDGQRSGPGTVLTAQRRPGGEHRIRPRCGEGARDALHDRVFLEEGSSFG